MDLVKDEWFDLYRLSTIYVNANVTVNSIAADSNGNDMVSIPQVYMISEMGKPFGFSNAHQYATITVS